MVWRILLSHPGGVAGKKNMVGRWRKSINLGRVVAYANRHSIGDLSTAIALFCGKEPHHTKTTKGKKKTKSRKGEIMVNTTCLQSQPLQVLKNKETVSVPEPKFTDNLTYIEFLVAEVQLWLAHAYLCLKKIDNISQHADKLAYLKIPPGITDRRELRDYINDLAEKRAQAEKTAESTGVRLRFQELVDKYHIDGFSRKVLQLVLVAETSMEFKAIYEECDIALWDTGMRCDFEIGVILSILCKDHREQMSCRAVFAIDQPLLKYEIIKLSGRHVSFLHNDVELDERVSRFCLDDHNVYDIDLLCINSEWPSIKLSQVVLAEDLKADLVRYSESFLTNSKEGHCLSEAFGYGAGLTCLFYGLSGTGKTMLAHGLANHLGCQLFSLNIGSLQHADISFEDAMQYIFREARLAGGIVFLDECDDLFRDDSYECRTFLIEVEKAECITILATNKTVKMDPALDRRISLKIPFTLPDEEERLSIWQALLPDGMQYGDDVDLKKLAEKYHFTGGLIKNSLLMAAGNAMVKTVIQNKWITLSEAEIHKAARHQAKSMFDLGATGKLSSPREKLADLDIRRIDLEKLQAVARLVPEIHQVKEGFCGLISAGYKRVGVDCVRAVAAEAGLQVRQFSMSSLLTKSINEEDRPLDPFTQQRISLLEYVFAERPGQQEIIILEDDTQLMEVYLGKCGKEAKWKSDIQRFKELLHDFRGILFVVTGPLAGFPVPIEFACYIPLSYPAEDSQIKAWKRFFPHLSDHDLVELVEQFPMYSQEISLVARQGKIAARLEGFAHPDFDLITETARRLRGKKTMPFLFGGSRGTAQ